MSSGPLTDYACINCVFDAMLWGIFDGLDFQRGMC